MHVDVHYNGRSRARTENAKLSYLRYNMESVNVCIEDVEDAIEKQGYFHHEFSLGGVNIIMVVVPSGVPLRGGAKMAYDLGAKEKML